MKSHGEVAVHTGHNGTSAAQGLAKSRPKSATSLRRLNMRVTMNLPVPLLDRLRNTVYWTPGLTLTGLIKRALHEHLEQVEFRHGQPFPPRLSELKSGRPRKRPASLMSIDAHEATRPPRLTERSAGAELAAASLK